jgi:hypothetical protein
MTSRHTSVAMGKAIMTAVATLAMRVAFGPGRLRIPITAHRTSNTAMV